MGQHFATYHVTLTMSKHVTYNCGFRTFYFECLVIQWTISNCQIINFLVFVKMETVSVDIGIQPRSLLSPNQCQKKYMVGKN